MRLTNMTGGFLTTVDRGCLDGLALTQAVNLANGHIIALPRNPKPEKPVIFSNILHFPPPGDTPSPAHEMHHPSSPSTIASTVFSDLEPIDEEEEKEEADEVNEEDEMDEAVEITEESGNSKSATPDNQVCQDIHMDMGMGVAKGRSGQGKKRASRSVFSESNFQQMYLADGQNSDILNQTSSSALTSTPWSFSEPPITDTDTEVQSTYVCLQPVTALPPDPTAGPIAQACGVRWAHAGRNILWITHLIVHADHRRQGVATRLLWKLRRPEDDIVGILSHHPAAIIAVARAFGDRGGVVPGSGMHSFGDDEIRVMEEILPATMREAPVEFVRDSHLICTEGEDGARSIICETGFDGDVDGANEVLAGMLAHGVSWPFGKKLRRGQEFALLVKTAY